jgi:hypothetical protein
MLNLRRKWRRCKRQYLEALASEAQAANDCQNSKELFHVARYQEVKKQNAVPVREDGNITAGAEDQLCR